VDGTWKLVIAAGGTGGHISPALAVADGVVRLDPACRVEFVCGRRPVELGVYRKAGIEPRAMAMPPPARSWAERLAGLPLYWKAMRAAGAWFATDPPGVVLGMGGYVCVPVVAAALRAGIATMIHEQNAVAGRANRMLGRWVAAVACGYREAAAAFPRRKTVVTGNPVRPEFVGADRGEALRRWDLADGKPTLLVFGGSQGARRLNRLVLEALGGLDSRAAAAGGMQVVWSCGERNFDELHGRLPAMNLANVVVRLVPFIREMGLAYAAADLAVCRAGAMTLAELAANGLPALVVPLPGATAGHQRLNALPFEKAGAVEIAEESELGAGKLAERIGALLFDRARLGRMGEANRRMGRPDAVEKIARMIIGLRGEIP